VNAGAFSGLETPTSDFVGLVGFASPGGFSASASARFDEQSFEVRRFEAKAGLNLSRFSITGKYAFIQKQPLYGFDVDRRETTVAASARLHEYWRVFGSGTYDFQTNLLVANSVGFSYDDECFSFAMTLAEQRYRIENTGAVKHSQSVGFRLSFRTIGDFGTDSNAFAN
jgi:LPS-assembly protein